MWGQWEGELRHANRRWHCALNIDSDRSSFGRLLLYDFDEYEAWSHGVLTTIRVGDADLNGASLTAALSFEAYPVRVPPSQKATSLLGEATNFDGVVRGGSIDATFELDGTTASLHLRDIQAGEALSARRLSSWNDFKAWVAEIMTPPLQTRPPWKLGWTGMVPSPF